LPAILALGCSLFFLRRAQTQNPKADQPLCVSLTRGSAPVFVVLTEALLTGLARGRRSLYVPEIDPDTQQTRETGEMATMSYEDVAFRVMKPFVGDTFQRPRNSRR